MAGTPTRRAADGARFQARLRPARTWLWLAFPLVLLLAVASLRVETQPLRPTWQSLTGAAANLTPDELKGAAADILERATREGGSGYTFEIVQRSTINARPGGPPLAIDPGETRKDPGLAETYPLATYLESGMVTPDGYWAEIRRGPDDPTAKPDFATGPVEMAALVRDGTTWRDDGSGWYATNRPPGLGLDPASAQLLPGLLRAASDVQEKDPNDPGAARALEATTTVADAPGIIAVDLVNSTELRGPATFAFDGDGRLVSLTLVARNTRLADYDLLVDTVITFAYPGSPPPLPEPTPVYVAPAPDQDGEGES